MSCLASQRWIRLSCLWATALLLGGHAFGATAPDTTPEKLLQLAGYQQALGDYATAAQTLSSALPLAEAAGDDALSASILASLGNAYIALKPLSTAEDYLMRAAELARRISADDIEAAALVNLGNVHMAQDASAKALGAYSEGAALAQQTGNSMLAARALANSAHAALQSGDYPRSHRTAAQAIKHTHGLPASRRKAFLYINVARTLERMRTAQPQGQTPLLLQAHDLLDRAVRVAEKTGDAHAVSYALGYLGALYESERRYAEALDLSQRAVFHAQEADENALLYRWHWQRGRIHKALGERQRAIEAYSNAVELLQGLRYRMQTEYGPRGAPASTSINSVYFQLTDLLLQQAADSTDPRREQDILKSARATVEQLKAAELRDYFQDECVDDLQAKGTSIDVVSPTTVVVYPILLEDRLELLLTLPGGDLRRYPVAVDAARITAETRKLRTLLEKTTTNEYRPHARQLYEWLVQPFEADLAPLNIDTLVFVPDGPLRTVPMTALFDGKQFLIEKYAVARTPSLELTDPRPLDREDRRALLGGLSKSVAGFPPLAHVPQELDSVQASYGGTRLLDEAFNQGALRKVLGQEELKVLHIATHGEFQGDVDNSFLLTYDGKLTFDELADYIGLFKFRDTPLELLVLSACKTADGDDRAALGLSGIAIKAGARSALGSLWEVNDVATAELMEDFYEHLSEPQASRAEALQHAQVTLRKDLRYRHPGFWSAFVLISNWL